MFPVLVLAGSLALLAIGTRVASGLLIRLRQRGRLPIIVHAADAGGVPVGDAMTSGLRTFLAEDIQRIRALVPGGSGVVTPSIPAQTPPLDATWTSAIFRFAFSEGPAFHVFTQVRRAAEGTDGHVDVQVVRRPGDRIVNARSFALHDGAIADIGAFCVQTVQSNRRVLGQTPRWEHWAGRGGYRIFRSALVCEQRGDLSGAVELYREAGTLSIGNVTISLRLASILERLGRYPEALREYRLCHELWPESLETAYRHAAALSNSRGAASAAAAAQVFSALERSLRLRSIASRYVRTLRPSRWNSGERAYWAGWLRPRRTASAAPARRSRRRDLRCAVAIARRVASLRSLIDASSAGPPDGAAITGLVAEVAALRRRRRLGWLAHYNAACFYSTCLEVSLEPSPEWDPAAHAARAASELAIVIRDPFNEVHPTWMSSDPDLEQLRRSDEYRYWCSYLGIRAS